MLLPGSFHIYPTKSLSLSQDQEKIKRKKVFAQKMEDTIRREASIVNPAFHIHERPLSDSHDHVSPLMGKLAQSAAVSQTEPYVPVPVASVPNVDKLKQERVKASLNSNSTDAVPVEVLPKKKVKKKQNPDAVEAPVRFEKVLEAEEKHKHHKNVAAPPSKSQGSENPS